MPLHADEQKKPAKPSVVRQVTWDDLKSEFTFEDPFVKLTEEQLMDLGIIARVQSLEKRDGGSRVTAGMRKEAQVQKIDLGGRIHLVGRRGNKLSQGLGVNINCIREAVHTPIF